MKEGGLHSFKTVTHPGGQGDVWKIVVVCQTTASYSNIQNNFSGGVIANTFPPLERCFYGNKDLDNIATKWLQ